MKIIAFFNLREGIQLRRFQLWVQTRQKPVFEETIPQMSNFSVLSLSDSDHCQKPGQIVQLFDWEGTIEEWRQTLKSFQDPENAANYRIAQEWLEMCDESSTQILYAEKIQS
jgi:hypothetical protein